MKKLPVLFSALVIGAMALAACGGGASQDTSVPGDTTSTEAPIFENTSIPNTGDLMPTDVMAQPTLAGDIATSQPTLGGDMQSSATPTQMSTLVANPTMVGTGIPNTGYGQLVPLSSLMGYQVVDNTGAIIGNVSDYVINMCEAQIVYAVVNVNGKSMLVPYAAATQRTSQPQSSGQPVLTLNVTSAQISGAPVLDVSTLDFENTTWESTLTSYWRQYVQLSLTTACNVPAAGSTLTPGLIGTQVPSTIATQVPITTDSSSMSGTEAAPVGTAQVVGTATNRVNVYRVALASDVLKANLVEGNGKQVGVVSDVMVFDNTGNVYYYLIQPVANASTGTGVVGTQTGSLSGTQVAPNNNLSSTQAVPSSNSSLNNAGLIAVPAGAVTVRHTSASGTSRGTQLVLLVQTNVFLNAPISSSVTSGSDGSMLDMNWSNYWSQFVPMTQSQLP